MSARYESVEGASFLAGFEELQRGTLALERNSSRPHKQLIQKGEFVHSTGNVVSLVGFNSTTVSLLEEVEDAIHNSTSTSSPAFIDYEPALNRSQLTITGKVFIKLDGASIATYVQDVVVSSLNELHTRQFDLLIFAVPDGASVGAVLELWAAAEAIYAQGFASLLGISNINLEFLQALCSSATVKPVTVQMTPNSTDLLKFVTSKGMNALVDSDSGRSSLDNAEQRYGRSFTNVLVPPYTRTVFEPLAVLRHTSVISDRGVVTSKGFTLKSRYTIA